MTATELQLLWRQVFADLGTVAPDIAPLLQAWQQPHRHYHTLQHLLECLEHWQQYQHHAQRPELLALALFFHDAIYDVPGVSSTAYPGADNEGRSALWAADCLGQAGVVAADIDEVVGHIVATRHFAGSPITAMSADRQLMLDIDLAILAASPARFAQYQQQIRLEYQRVPRWLYRWKRRQILKSFLKQPQLFQSPYLNHWQVTAQANIRSALKTA
jgi:predicted metal-dependent HD superfamily phosphohydrolase